MCKILVIEDDANIRSNIVEMLEDEGYKVLEAQNGAVGVQLAQVHLPDLILCDVMMPEIDGYGVLKILRQTPSTALIPFVYVTAKTDKSDLRQGMNLGADDYLTKPFTRLELLDAITARLVKQATASEHYSDQIRQLEEKFNTLLHFDSTTGLPNHLSFQDHFDTTIAEAAAPHSQFAVLCLKLYQFERVRTTFEESLVDQILQAITAQIKTCVTEQDTIVRLVGDQFALLLARSAQDEDGTEQAQSILTSLTQPLKLEGQTFYLNPRIGIACYPEDASNASALLKRAELAASYAQQQINQPCELFRAELATSSADAILLEQQLREALERSEFRLYYQPQIDLTTHHTIGAEALIRWEHPEKGMVSPARFMPLAEETSLILPIGEWVLRTACAQMVDWQQANYPINRISVNLSTRQFNQPDLVQRFSQILQETGLSPEFLKLEITESCLIENPQAAIATLTRLKELGIQIAIDDFGTGYSSLSYLKQFPFDTLKVDQYFVRGIHEDPKNIEIVRAIIQMAHNLGLKVIAEGVETELELVCLMQCQCNEVQGYFFSRPLPVVEFEKLLNNSHESPTAR
ncbi:hypothetical protein BST81_12510 [Leptolyngbya sp. 'hensonii']|uniref:EAL domain-containing response regulator n=1 Tax=Leptolyngbya sp. 'hensonii' TaxID=1922337 RepID=UPI00094F882F|nr:EAL domain-containing response regulator [Leptolyngbya sp. 'hensonii']OLP17875.1 hypothetical protein BST81_12510 [Leptolyngbya sp. 'hensonii']